MRKKKLITTFTDQAHIHQDLNQNFSGSGRFVRRSYSGDSINDILDPNVTINFKNEHTKAIELKKGIVSSKIGNDYIFNDIRSSNDNSHYFDGNKKFIDLKFSFFSSTFTVLDNTFKNVDFLDDPNIFNELASSITVSPIDGAVYVVVQASSSYLLRRSSRGLLNSFLTVDTMSTIPSASIASSVDVSPIDGAVYWSGVDSSNLWFVRKSTNGSSGSFTTIDSTGSTTPQLASSITVSPIDGAVYVAGYIGTQAIVRKSTNGSSGSFTTIDSPPISAAFSPNSITVSPIDGAVYVAGSDAGGACIRKSTNGSSGSFINIFNTSSLNTQFKSIAVTAISRYCYSCWRIRSYWQFVYFFFF